MCAARSRRGLWTDFLKKEKSKCISSSEALPISDRYSATHFRGRILGIDPSLRGTGLAIIDIKGRDEIALIFSKTVKIPPRETLLACTGKIFSEVSLMIAQFVPDVCAAEQTIYVQNFQTAQVMGIARGAILAAIASHGLNVFEYAPLRIKQAVCGYGQASKEQVSGMVQAILKTSIDVSLDETDAAAAAICCYFTEKSLDITSKLE